MFGGAASTRLRAEGKHHLPILEWIGTPLHAWLRTVAPAEFGGQGNIIEDAKTTFENPEERRGRSIDEIAAYFAFHDPRRQPDRLINTPGLPIVYEWEATPQEPEVPKDVDKIFSRLLELNNDVDGIIFQTIEEYEPPEALMAGQQILGKNGIRPLFLVGAQQPPTVWTAGDSKAAGTLARPLATKDGDTAVFKFLDKCEEEFGARSVLYISFGSFFWPARHPEIVEDIVETLLNMQPPIPFLFALSSPLANLSSALAERIKTSPQCLFLPWVPQTLIFQHPGLGLFLTHGGMNSSTEALIFEMPMILMPFHGDQGTNAIILSSEEYFDVGIELLQFRTGEALEKGLAYRNGGTKIEGTSEARRKELKDVLQRMRAGDEADKKRKNVGQLGTTWRNSIKENGSAWKQFRELDRWMITKEAVTATM
ncbi:glycosyltransferase family 1 protein [Atractiella rhizophila]|nr:glycosyltransferase family 1 protein [Atractiella rhizophila]